MNQSLKTIIQILNDSQFHSEAELSHSLGLTQTEICLLLEQLTAWDIDVESSTHLGYRMLISREFLDKDKILNYIPRRQRQLIHQLEIYDCLPSTNDYLMQFINEKTKGIRVCLAEKQTAGKGRLGRRWHSPYASNISLSLLWHYPKKCNQLLGLSLAIAVGIVNALQEYGIPSGLTLKWPNDVYWQGKKLAGILIETFAQANGITPVIIGVGLNVDIPNTSKIATPWIDLTQIILGKPKRNRLSSLLLKNLCLTLTLFQEQGFAAFKQAWQALDLAANEAVTLVTPLDNIQGTALGVNQEGCLLLKDNTGKITSFSSGDISLRINKLLTK